MMYIENYSLLLDIEILFKTLKILFIKESTEGFDDGGEQAMFDREMDKADSHKADETGDEEQHGT